MNTQIAYNNYDDIQAQANANHDNIMDDMRFSLD